MTPKEKATNLANLFVTKSVFDMTNEELKQERLLAKRHALIAVDEIHKTVNMCIPYINDETYADYWQEVKQHLNNI
tara:strand:+ start:1425 stop:1652 length:228 start_codon:yes stop_codon:yes gene_type:complete